MYLEELRKIVIDIFKDMLENGEIPAIEGGEFWRNSMSSDAILYDNDKNGCIFINHTDNFDAEETSLPIGTEDVYIGIEDAGDDVDMIKTLGFPKETDIKALIKDVYMKFYNANKKSTVESIIEKLDNIFKTIE